MNEQSQQQQEQQQELFPPSVIEHLKKIGVFLLSMGGSGSIRIDVFQGVVTDVITQVETTGPFL